MQHARIIWLGFLAAVLFLTLENKSFAAPTHGEAPAESSNLDIFAGALDLAIWTVVVFLILLFVLSKFAWKPMLEGLRKREASIKGAVEEAKKVRAEMAAQQAEFDRKLAEANQEIPRLMAEARRDAELLKEEMRAQTSAEINSERQRLRREIEVAKDQALQEIWNQAANLATVISAQAIRKELKADDHKRLVDEALAEIHERAARDPGRASEIGLEWVRKAGGKV